jgi:hypothetical protein
MVVEDRWMGSGRSRSVDSIKQVKETDIMENLIWNGKDLPVIDMGGYSIGSDDIF